MIDNANDSLISRIELIIVAFLGIVAGDMMIAMNLSIFRMSGAMN
jgi:type II secretory pathway component PulF